MNNENKEHLANSYLINCLKIQKNNLELQGYSVAYICIHGSQNYNLDIYTDDYKSDVDIKAIVVPTLDDLINNSKPVSKVIKTEWGQCDIKDIREYFKILLKANPAYIETLFTNYHIIDIKFAEEFKKIFKLREKLVETLSAQFIRAIYGMMCEKEKALCHPYPTIAHKIDKYGYDGKQAHHIFRLYYMMEDYFINGKSMINCLYPPQEYVEFLMDLKLNNVGLDDAKKLVEIEMKKAKELKDMVLNNIDESKIDYSIKDEVINLANSIIKNKIIEEIRKMK